MTGKARTTQKMKLPVPKYLLSPLKYFWLGLSFFVQILKLYTIYKSCSYVGISHSVKMYLGPVNVCDLVTTSLCTYLQVEDMWGPPGVYSTSPPLDLPWNDPVDTRLDAGLLHIYPTLQLSLTTSLQGDDGSITVAT